MKCSHIDVLKTYLTKYPHQLDHKPNGQSMYKFDDGLVLNVYETGSIVFQGQGSSSELANQIRSFIASINVEVVMPE